MSCLRPYTGSQRGLVLAFDVGTTFSGVGYAVLDPKQTPKIQGVSRYPGQPSGDFKIPSVLYYTQDGRVRAIGAEAREPGFELVAHDEDLVFVEWFKLRLCPEHMDADKLEEADLCPLPLNKTVIDVFADFLAYLFSCARRFITETHLNGMSVWSSVEKRIDFVLSHPNGWEGSQQAKMRQAAVKAGLVPDTQTGRARIHFVTEGEASLHYCINSGLVSDFIEDGARAMIVDAGGGTVDLSTYRFTDMSPISVEEIAPPGCILQGSTRVNARALTFLKNKLERSRFGNDEDLILMMENFEKSTKPTFKDGTDRSFIKFGRLRDHDPAVDIRSGQLTLDGADVAQLFLPSVMGIVSAVREQCRSASHTVSHAFLVGGFAASPWLFAKLQDILRTMNIELSRPDGHTNKAVAEGAVSFFLMSFVAARLARFTYGVTCSRTFDENDPEHVLRRHQVFHLPSGRILVPGGYRVYLNKGVKIKDNAEIRHSFMRESTKSSRLGRTSTDLTCYRGETNVPEWADTEPESFSSLCTVRADTSGVKRDKIEGPNGPYYVQEYDVVLLCGLTELKAQICWIENGEEKRGEAQIVYDDYDDGEIVS